jgi:hypothetical protein
MSNTPKSAIQHDKDKSAENNRQHDNTSFIANSDCTASAVPIRKDVQNDNDKSDWSTNWQADAIRLADTISKDSAALIYSGNNGGLLHRDQN